MFTQFVSSKIEDDLSAYDLHYVAGLKNFRRPKYILSSYLLISGWLRKTGEKRLCDELVILLANLYFTPPRYLFHPIFSFKRGVVLLYFIGHEFKWIHSDGNYRLSYDLITESYRFQPKLYLRRCIALVEHLIEIIQGFDHHIETAKSVVFYLKANPSVRVLHFFNCNMCIAEEQVFNFAFMDLIFEALPAPVQVQEAMPIAWK